MKNIKDTTRGSRRKPHPGKDKKMKYKVYYKYENERGIYFAGGYSDPDDALEKLSEISSEPDIEKAWIEKRIDKRSHK